MLALLVAKQIFAVQIFMVLQEKLLSGMEEDMLHSHYERNLPHRLPPGHTVFITYRLAGTLPWHVRQLLEEEELLTLPPPITAQEDRIRRRKSNFVRYDHWLDHESHTSRWLAEPAVAAVMRESLLHFDGSAYTLHAFCIMPNHVHFVATIAEQLGRPFYRVLQSQKRFSSTKANRLLGRKGAFWQRESYDHLVRDGREFAAVLGYVLRNPIKAGLVENWPDWPHTYLAEEL